MRKRNEAADRRHYFSRESDRLSFGPQSRGDKSAFLALGGFTSLNPDVLLAELRDLKDKCDGEQIEENRFGRYYEVVGTLNGPLGVGLRVRTIWMTEHLSGVTKFITLIPIEVTHV